MKVRTEHLATRQSVLMKKGLGSWADEMEDMPLPCELFPKQIPRKVSYCGSLVD